MTTDMASCLLTAAGGDAVLAAWASVVWMVDVAEATAISPYDAWDAFEEFYSLGLITEAQYEATDRRRFFATGITLDAYQRVYNRMRALVDQHQQPQEPPRMSSKKPSIGNPFAETALVTKDRESALASGREAASLPVRQSSPGLPFAPSREVLSPSPGMMDPMPAISVPRGTSRGGLPCNDPVGGGNLARVGSHEIEVEIYCCGQKLEMMEDGGQMVGPDDLPGGQISVIDVIFHGRCQSCQAIHHHSVGKPIPQENFR